MFDLNIFEKNVELWHKVKADVVSYHKIGTVDELYNKYLNSFLQEYGFYQDSETKKYFLDSYIKSKDIETYAKAILEVNSDLFETKVVKRLFSKNLLELRLKKSPKEIIYTLLSTKAENNKKLQNAIENIRKDIEQDFNRIKEDVKFVTHKKRDERQQESAKQNKEKYGNLFDAGIINYDTNVNIDAICLVHATRYMPKKDEQGNLSIESTSYATGGLLPRATIHFTANHIVESHVYGNWDEMPYVLLIPFKSMIEKNGKPLTFAPADTYYLTDPEKPLSLPKNVFLLKPSEKLKKLYTISPNGITFYKRDNFSEYEKQQLLYYYGKASEQQPIDNKFFAFVSRQLAAEKTLEYMGFSYLHTSLQHGEHEEMYHRIFYKSAKAKGLNAAFGAREHVSNVTQVPKSQTANDVYMFKCMNKEAMIYDTEYEINRLKSWGLKHIINKEPLKEIDTSGRYAINKPVVEKYKKATEKLLKQYREKYKTKEELFKYIDSLEKQKL